jgi:hypothetical protein
MSRKLKKEKICEYRRANCFLSVIRWLTDIYIFIMIGIYPFIVRAGYSTTSYLKYSFLIGISYGFKARIIYIPTFIPCVAALTLIGTVRYLKNADISFNEFIKTIKLSAVDKAVLIYGVTLVISSLVSASAGELLWGYPTWNMGLASQFLFIAIYFIISRFFDLYELELVVYEALIASAGVFLIEICQKLGFNVFGLYGNAGMMGGYVSTIGNINWFSSYAIIFTVMGAFIVWFFDRTTLLYKIGLIHLLISSLSIVTQGSDSAFAGLFVFLSFLFIWSLDSEEILMKFFGVLLVMLLCWRVVGIIRLIRGPEAMYLGDLPLFFAQNKLLWGVVVAVCIIYLLLSVRQHRGIHTDMSRFAVCKKIYVAVVLIIILMIVTYIILNTKGLLPENLSSTSKYLYFNARWGSNRGALWHDTFYSLAGEAKQEPLRMIFGRGADQYYSLLGNYVSDQTKEVLGKSTVSTNAHNEWLTAFVNYGIFGGVSYAAIFILSIVSYIRSRHSTPYVMCTAACAAAYMAHNFFSFQQFVCTPFIFIILAIGEQIIRSGYTGYSIEKNHI